jgi:class 3 adenylate cyclase
LRRGVAGMKVSGKLQSLAVRALSESMDVHTMTVVARRLFDNYDLYKRTGFPGNLSIPNQDAASQIVRDIRESDRFLDFVTLLIESHERGLKGRRIRIPYLREIVGEMMKEGLIYDEAEKLFFEDSRLRKTSNWGVLREQVEYLFTFLRIDIVGNTDLVRMNDENAVQESYRDFREIVQGIVERRNGRVWNWEGDGGLSAFHFSNKDNHAALSAMEIVNELHLYNLMRCRLKNPLSVRMAVHGGPCEFREKFEEIHSDTIMAVLELESKFTKPGTVSFSGMVYRNLSPLIAKLLTPIADDPDDVCYRYELQWEG